VLDKNPGSVKLVHKNYPLANHKMAMPAAMAALAADRQGKFWEFHHDLHENFKEISEQKIQEIARKLSLDAGRFEKDKSSAEIKNLIDRDVNEARALGVKGIPSVFINGIMLKDRSPEGFQEMIDKVLKKTPK
jgi:protein-disulfide isomerase